ncbi:hypothetical protein CYMTET_52746 [Cymbomonas tetramitiformis]|uniref:Uncharacterized protein n=1 Tax=Cymbomonas tetramitiformis TaxID=36881 RepID=A0AAE0ERB3_9CHLO|nr:hypothetical protein CYMTET_52746 [Cymbomonas tetramitiformis]
MASPEAWKQWVRKADRLCGQEAEDVFQKELDEVAPPPSPLRKVTDLKLQRKIPTAHTHHTRNTAVSRDPLRPRTRGGRTTLKTPGGLPDVPESSHSVLPPRTSNRYTADRAEAKGETRENRLPPPTSGSRGIRTGDALAYVAGLKSSTLIQDANIALHQYQAAGLLQETRNLRGGMQHDSALNLPSSLNTPALNPSNYRTPNQAALRSRDPGVKQPSKPQYAAEPSGGRHRTSMAPNDRAQWKERVKDWLKHNGVTA